MIVYYMNYIYDDVVIVIMIIIIIKTIIINVDYALLYITVKNIST